MIRIDDTLLEEIGLIALPKQDRDQLLRQIYETLEMRVGMRLAERMTDQQLDEFERFIDTNDEAGALKWLETNFPDYKQVVADELEKLKGEIKKDSGKIMETMQAQGSQAPAGTQPAPLGASAGAPTPQPFSPSSPPTQPQPFQASPSQPLAAPQPFAPQPLPANPTSQGSLSPQPPMPTSQNSFGPQPLTPVQQDEQQSANGSNSNNSSPQPPQPPAPAQPQSSGIVPPPPAQ